MEHKKAITIGVSIAIVLGIALFAVYKQKGETPVPAPAPQTQEKKPLSNADENALQRKIQNIFIKGTESDCASLADSRYQYACHDFFKNTKKK